MTPVFSSSECVISLVLSCFYWSEGGTPFLCFFVLATVVLLNAVISRVLAWFLGGPRKDRVLFMTLFFGVSQSWIVCIFCWTLLFLEFLLVFASFSCL